MPLLGLTFKIISHIDRPRLYAPALLISRIDIALVKSSRTLLLVSRLFT